MLLFANENNDKAYDLAIKQAYTNGVMDLSRYLDTGEKTEMLEIVIDEIRKEELWNNERDD